MTKFKKENPDKEADAELGENVEHLVEEHFEENPEAEAKEGHKLSVKKKLDDKIAAMKKMAGGTVVTIPKSHGVVAPNHPKMPKPPKMPGTHAPKGQPKIQKSLDDKIKAMHKASEHIQEQPKEPFTEDVNLLEAVKRDPKERIKEKIGILKEMAAFLKSVVSDNDMQKKYMGFEAVKEKVAAGGARDPGAVAAAIGRKKYGKAKFQAAAAAGKKMGKNEKMKKDGAAGFMAGAFGSDAPSSPPPAAAPTASTESSGGGGGQTINSRIGNPFGKTAGVGHGGAGAPSALVGGAAIAKKKK